MEQIDGCQTLYSGGGISSGDDVDLTAFPSTTKTHSLIPVDQNHADSSANHNHSLILGTVIPT